VVANALHKITLGTPLYLLTPEPISSLWTASLVGNWVQEKWVNGASGASLGECIVPVYPIVHQFLVHALVEQLTEC